MSRDKRILVGVDTSDDAGVFRISAESALVQTLDVITPIVDDPEDFGYIAAINALSDIFAMGGSPLTALTFLAFEQCDLPMEAASLILKGGLKAMSENNCAVLGGHTLEDAEIKFGFAVTGTVHPDQVITNSGAGEGDLIYLTKPLGTGIASTALKGELLPSDMAEEFVNWMKRSNGPGAEATADSGASAATDVTGFGLLGHLWEMCSGSGLGAVLYRDSIPEMNGIKEMVDTGMVPAGAYRNRDHLEGKCTFTDEIKDSLWPLFDPQTSGGLLIAVPQGRADSLERALETRDVPINRIGMFRSQPGIEIKTRES
jgi:selenide,water dikinase